MFIIIIVIIIIYIFIDFAFLKSLCKELSARIPFCQPCDYYVAMNIYQFSATVLFSGAKQMFDRDLKGYCTVFHHALKL